MRVGLAVAARVRFAEQKRPRGRRDVLLAHQAFADEKGRDAHALRRRQSSCVKIPLSLTTIRSGGIFLMSRSRNIERNFEVAQIAIVDADKPGLEPQCPGKFGFVVNLDKNVHAKIMRGAGQAGSLPRR